ncbi:MAG: DUF192 domain-containing protein [Deltaproteobacteria bacterium]|jgi:hypothetical protein|nr:DUF192 domain-containing protein [Deltaproteobacteria bacterium]
MSKAITVLLLAGMLGCGDSQPTQRARLLDEDGNVQLELELALAETEYERQEGLRLHGPLAENEALLLVFPKETRVCITNTGVPFPIDVVYLSATRHVIATELNIPPNAPGPYCHQAQLALELNGDRLRSFNYVKLELF